MSSIDNVHVPLSGHPSFSLLLCWAMATVFLGNLFCHLILDSGWLCLTVGSRCCWLQQGSYVMTCCAALQYFAIRSIRTVFGFALGARGSLTGAGVPSGCQTRAFGKGVGEWSRDCSLVPALGRASFPGVQPVPPRVSRSLRFCQNSCFYVQLLVEAPNVILGYRSVPEFCSDDHVLVVAKKISMRIEVEAALRLHVFHLDLWGFSSFL